MSAGGLSYSAITTYGKTTLPSVESGLGSLNVIRDPPKSIMTRRKDKVGETMDITQMIDDSSDRACEAILQYPRGINPAVGVSFSNYGTNGGVVGNHTNLSTQHLQAKLPYRIGDVFRPPLLRQENLLPLSRLPRVLFTHTTNPEFPDFSKKLMCPGSEPKRTINENPIHAFARPTAVYSVERPIDIKKPVKEVCSNIEYYNVKSNLGSTSVKREDRNPINIEKYIQDPRHHSAITNISGYDNNNDINAYKNIKLDRKMPIISNMTANSGINGIDSGNVASKKYNLREKIKYGGYSNGGIVPSIQRQNYRQIPLNTKTNLYKKSMGQYEGRFKA